jgi:hypothetical protein
VIHSLDSFGFLKIDPSNHLYFKCQYYDNRTISIEQEWDSPFDEEIAKKEKENEIRAKIGMKYNDEVSKDWGVENKYNTIYQVKIKEITLRELMILQSFYLCAN